jgi:cytoskeleton protein RodZ
LRCDESIITALESERFADLGAPVFVQGHLRRYAESLGLSVEPLLAEWSSRHAAAVAGPDLTQVPRPNRPVRLVDPGKVARPLAILAAAIVITLAAWWVLQGAGTAVEPVAAKPIPETLEPPTPVATASEAAPAPVVAEVRRELVLSADCWIEIYDSRSERIFFDLARAGSRIPLSGQGPWRILAGRADALTLEIDGRRQSIPSAMIRKSTANFTLDASGGMTAIPTLEANP